ncbi:MAG: hypothetical protein HY657_04715 [Acidobacteria bacterium]|nr:hypothetical protein [Acidobacteriota bacterium]
MDTSDRDRDFGDEDRTTLEDPLGIARQPVSKDGHIRASHDETSVRRRRKRAGLGPQLEERSTGLDDPDMDPFGATGIDMGYGGEGTNISDEGTSQGALPLDIPAEPLGWFQYCFGALRAPRTAMRRVRRDQDPRSGPHSGPSNAVTRVRLLTTDAADVQDPVEGGAMGQARTVELGVFPTRLPSDTTSLSPSFRRPSAGAWISSAAVT